MWRRVEARNRGERWEETSRFSGQHANHHVVLHAQCSRRGRLLRDEVMKLTYNSTATYKQRGNFRPVSFVLCDCIHHLHGE